MDLLARIESERSTEPVVGVAIVSLSEQQTATECPQYLAALRRTVALEPPPFGAKAYADLYQTASADGQWLAISLMSNAQREGDGATRLWSMAACCPDPDVRLLLKRHAVDESGHALAYLALLDLVFPGAVTAVFRAELGTLSPRYSMGHEVFPVEGSPYARSPSIDDFVQMNVAEIRTAIHHTMQRPALEQHCPAENARRVSKTLDGILRDELTHVAYTAKLIEERADTLGPVRLGELFTRRVRDFNQITREELGQLVFD
jgi:rubrerythrin